MAARANGDIRCKDCPEPHAPGKSRCEACAEKRRVDEAARRTQRRKRRQCLTCGNPAEQGRRYCKRHLRYYAARDRARKSRAA